MFSEQAGPDIGHDVMCQKVGGREQNLDQGSLGLGSPVSVIEPHIYSWSESITQRPIVLKAAGYFLKPIIVIL